MTNSVLEAHRMNSSYMLEGKDTKLSDLLKKELDMDKESAIDIPKFAKFVFKYDTNTVLHGLFLAKKDLSGGRYKIPRSLSSFIEATNIQPAVSGGVKLDRLDASGKEEGGAKEGYGHIPFSRIEYTAESIKVYFNIDLSLIRSYNLGDGANELLFTLALWKIRSFLKTGLRLRTACDLKIKNKLVATYPDDFVVPDLSDLDTDLKGLIKKCTSDGLFAKVPIVIEYSSKKNSKKTTD